mgnify:CR=1 FL=1
MSKNFLHQPIAFRGITLLGVLADSKDVDADPFIFNNLL